MIISSSVPYLSLYVADSLRDWESRIDAIVSRMGYNYANGGKIWRQNDRQILLPGIDYCDGFRISSIRLGPKYHGLAINPHRYFFEAGQSIPSSRPSWEFLTDNQRIASRPLARRIEGVQELHNHLVKAGYDIETNPVQLQEYRSDLLKNVRIQAGPNDTEYNIGTAVARIIQREGFQIIPAFEVLISAPAGDEKAVNLYCHYLTNAFSRAHTKCHVKSIHWDSLVKILVSENTGDFNSTARIILVGIHGKKGDVLRAEETSALRFLDDHRISYRMFSLENSAMDWSAFDQLSILVQGVGGKPYSVQLPHDHSQDPLLFVGLDLGHPLNSDISWVVATIVDNAGHLIGFWRNQQSRDETLKGNTLSAALNWIYLVWRKVYRGQCRIMILRDGRLFENENPDQYVQFFGTHHSLVEVIKHPVPLMLVGKECAPQGTMCVPKDSPLLFVLTSRNKNPSEINLPLKIRVVHDGLGIGDHGICQTIAGLSFAPTLGLNPTRTPSPIYWANGLASMSDTNHQFNGIHWVLHN